MVRQDFIVATIIIIANFKSYWIFIILNSNIMEHWVAIATITTARYSS